MLKRNFKIDSTATGWPLRFVYLAQSGRLQVYLGGRDAAGQFQPERTYLDEVGVRLHTQAEGKALADKFMLSAEVPDHMEFPREVEVSKHGS